MKIVIDIPEEEYNLIKIKSESNIGGVSSEAERAIAKGTPIPDNATNGDVIKAMFPHHDIEVNEQKNYVQVFYDSFYTTYPLRWWLESYKAGE